MKPANRIPLGGKIALIAPASGGGMDNVAEACNVIKRRGFVPVLGDNIRCLRSRGMFSATMEQRIDELKWSVEDKDIAAIFAIQGGFGCAQLLPHIDFGRIGSAAKPMMGFSDFTALNNGIAAGSGLVTFNGPMAAIRLEPSSERAGDITSLDDAIALLSSEDAWKSFPFTKMAGGERCVFPGKASGTSIGGNLRTLECLIGTNHFPDPTNSILFMEDVGVSGYDLAMILQHFKLAGILDALSGVVIGDFVDVPDEANPGDPSIEDVIVDFFKDGPPCACGFKFGHGDMCACIPIGAETKLDSNIPLVEFEYKMA